MSNMMKLMNNWHTTIFEQWYQDLDPDQKVWICNKVIYQALLAAGRSFLYYLDNPHQRPGALDCAVAYRTFASYFDVDMKANYEQMAEAISSYIIKIDDIESAEERPDWITEDEWKEAMDEAIHDADGNLITPQLEGFLTGAHYDVPSVYPTEFDAENARKVVRNCMQAALKKCQDNQRYALRRLTKPNSAKWKAIWQNKSWNAKNDVQGTEAFIKQHGLEWDE